MKFTKVGKQEFQAVDSVNMVFYNLVRMSQWYLYSSDDNLNRFFNTKKEALEYFEHYKAENNI